MKQDMLQKIQSYFQNKKEVAVVYMFGSHARDEAKADSDVDIAVLFCDNNSANTKAVIRFISDLGAIVNKKTDVCDISAVDLLFAYRILSEGKIIFSADEQKRIDFEVNLMRKYFDMKDFFTEYYDTVSKLAREGRIDDRSIAN